MSALNREELVNRLAEEARKFRKSNLRKRNVVINDLGLLFQMDMNEKFIVISSKAGVSFLLAETSRTDYRTFFGKLLDANFNNTNSFQCRF